MGYFSALADAAFKENPKEKGWLYYPNGILSKGRIVRDSETKEKLHNFQKRMYMFGIPVFILFGLGMDIQNIGIIDFILPALFCISIFLRQRFLIKGLEKSKVKLGYKESVNTGFRGLPIWYAYLLFASSVYLLLFGLYLLVEKNDTYLSLILIVAALGSSIFGYMIHRAKKYNK